jgi:hypothetical protein
VIAATMRFVITTVVSVIFNRITSVSTNARPIASPIVSTDVRILVSTNVIVTTPGANCLANYHATCLVSPLATRVATVTIATGTLVVIDLPATREKGPPVIDFFVKYSKIY